MIEKILYYPASLLDLILGTRLLSKMTSTTSSAVALLVTIVVFWSFPSYDVAFVTNEMDTNWASIFLQAKEPFVNHNNLYEVGSHGEKLAFRFVPAVILNILNIRSLKPAFIFQFSTLVFFYYLLILVFNNFFKDQIKAFVFALPICFVIAGHVYISDYRGIFDTLALDFLLLALLVRNKVYVIIPLLLAYFTDERALIASPAMLLIIILEKNSFDNVKSIVNSFLFSSSVYLFISWIIYVIVRFLLGAMTGLESGTGGINLFLEQLNKTFYTVYIGLEGFLIPLVFIIVFLLKKRVYAFIVLLFTSYLLVFYVGQSVLDINRSMSYAILIVILILIMLDKFFAKEITFRIIAWIIIINILYDDSYPFLVQLYRMKFITHSI